MDKNFCDEDLIKYLHSLLKANQENLLAFKYIIHLTLKKWTEIWESDKDHICALLSNPAHRRKKVILSETQENDLLDVIKKIRK